MGAHGARCRFFSGLLKQRKSPGRLGVNFKGEVHEATAQGYLYAVARKTMHYMGPQW